MGFLSQACQAGIGVERCLCSARMRFLALSNVHLSGFEALHVQQRRSAHVCMGCARSTQPPDGAATLCTSPSGACREEAASSDSGEACLAAMPLSVLR